MNPSSFSAVNQRVDAVFVLSVKTFHDRIRHIEAELGRHGIAFEWIFEHDADELTEEEIEAVFAPSDMKRGQQSLVLKHIETWKRCVERNYRRVLVFEDDAVLARDFNGAFDTAMDEADAVQVPYMIYLGCGDNKYVERARHSTQMLVVPGIELPATDATVLDRSAAELRLAYIAQRRITRPADWLMREADAAMGITQYWLREPIVEQGSMNGRFVSVLDDKRTDRGRRLNWLRYRWDRWRRRTLGSTRPEAARFDAGEARTVVRRDIWAIEVGRFAAAMTAIGAFVVPTLANAAAGVMLIALLAAPSRSERLRRVLGEPLGRATLLLGVVLAVSMLWSPLPLKPLLREWFGWRHLAWLFVALALFDTRASKYRFAALFCAASALTACASLSFWLFDISRSTNADLVHVVFRNHVTQGMSFAAGALFAFALATRPGAGRGERNIWSVAGVILLSGVLLSTPGRSAYVMIGVSTVVVAAAALRRGGGSKIAYVAAAAVVAVLLALSPKVGDRFQQGWKELREADQVSVPTSMGMRVVIWRNALRLIGEAPLAGHGLGSFETEYRKLVEADRTDWRARPSADPHSQYLSFIAQAGSIGLAAFLWWLIAALRQPVHGTFRVVGVALLLSWCVTSLFSSHFQTFNEGHMIAMFLGALLAREDAVQPASIRSAASSTSP